LYHSVTDLAGSRNVSAVSWRSNQHANYSSWTSRLLAPPTPKFFNLALQPLVSQGLLIHEVSRSHSTTHHSWWDSSGRVIVPSQRPLPDNNQHSQQTDIHASGEIRTHNLSRRADADPRLRPRVHWDRPRKCLTLSYLPPFPSLNWLIIDVTKLMGMWCHGLWDT